MFILLVFRMQILLCLNFMVALVRSSSGSISFNETKSNRNIDALHIDICDGLSRESCEQLANDECCFDYGLETCSPRPTLKRCQVIQQEEPCVTILGCTWRDEQCISQGLECSSSDYLLLKTKAHAGNNNPLSFWDGNEPLLGSNSKIPNSENTRASKEQWRSSKRILETSISRRSGRRRSRFARAKSRKYARSTTNSRVKTLGNNITSISDKRTLNPTSSRISASTPLCQYQAPSGLPWLAKVDQKESDPSQPCSSFTSSQTCRNNNFCCWNEDTSACSMVVQQPRFDCTQVTDQIACSKIWCHVCKWHENSNTCRRAHPSTSTMLTPDAICQTVTSYHKQASSSTLDDEYCFVKSLDKPCVFPFTPGDNGVVAKTCVSISATPPPRPLGGPVDAKWCAVVQSFDARKKKTIKPSQYGICTCISKRNRPRSIVMIIMDDMRPALRAAYGTWKAKTPNIDALTMREGTVVFDRAYVQYAVCGPSRNSFLSGMYPETNRIITNGESFQTNPSIRDRVTLLPQMFKEAGFYTMGGGKIFHHLQDDTTGKSWDESYAPSEEQNRECLDDTQRRDWMKFGPNKQRFLLGCTTKAEQNTLLDFSTVNAAKKALRKAVHNGKEPFFLAVGIYKPHSAYRLVPKFLKKFKPTTIPDVLRAEPPLPKNLATVQYTVGEADVLLDTWGRDPYQQKDSSLRRMIRQAYFACIYQSDEAVGRILNSLKTMKLEESALVILFGDHGYFLGENNLVAKNNNFEIATRAPLIMHIPWLKRAVNMFEPNPSKTLPLPPTSPILQPDRRVFEFFEFVDILPTLASLMNIPIPSSAEGLDMSNVVTAKAIWGATTGIPQLRDAAFSQVSRCGKDVSKCTMQTIGSVTSMGYTVRTDEWRFTVYLPSPSGDTDWNAQPLSVELYSHASDHENLFNYYVKPGPRFEFVENENVASKHLQICDKLFGLIRKNFEHRRIPNTQRARNYSHLHQMDALNTESSWYLID